MSKSEKRMAQNYEIIHGIYIGDKEVVFGVEESNQMPYFCGFYTSNGIFESYDSCMVGDDYAEMMELFAERVKAQCVKLREEQSKITVPREKITDEMCFSISDIDLNGKIAAVKAEALRPEYRSAENQLVYVTGGNGARKNSIGTACFCTNIYNGKQVRWERYDLYGEVKPEYLPDWAKERITKLKEQQTIKAKKERDER